MFFIAAVLRYNPHAKIHPWKVYNIAVFSTFTELHVTITTNFRSFHHSRKKPSPLILGSHSSYSLCAHPFFGSILIFFSGKILLSYWIKWWIKFFKAFATSPHRPAGRLSIFILAHRERPFLRTLPAASPCFSLCQQVSDKGHPAFASDPWWDGRSFPMWIGHSYFRLELSMLTAEWTLCGEPGSQWKDREGCPSSCLGIP